MADKRTHPVRNGIIATVVGGLVLSAIPPLRGFVLEALSWGSVGITWIWETVVSHYSMPGWAFLIIGLLSFIGLVQICRVLAPKTMGVPGYRSYVEDKLDGAVWRWSWSGNRISNLWCFCPTCDAQLVPGAGDDETHFICERCPPDERHRHHGFPGRVVANIRGDRLYALGVVEREILRRIRTGERGGISN